MGELFLGRFWSIRKWGIKEDLFGGEKEELLEV